MNQLTSEINRIGNTTEFNTQKILNGGGEVKEIQMNTKQTGATAGAFKGGAPIAAEYTMGVKGTSAGATSKINATGTSATWTSTITDVFAGGTTDATGKAFTFEGVTITVKAAGAGDDLNAGQATLGAISAGAVEVTLDTGSATGASATNVADALKAAFNAYKASSVEGTNQLDNFEFTNTGADYTITADSTLGDTKNNSAVTGNIAGANLANASGDGAFKGQTIDFGAENGKAANDITVKFASRGDAGDATAEVNGNEITILLGTGGSDNTTATVEAALQGLTTELGALGIDATKITVSGEDLGAVANDVALVAGSKTSNAVAGGNAEEQKVNFGKENMGAANALKIQYASGGSDAAASATFAGDTITISLGTTAANNTAENVQAALRGLQTDLGTVGVDASKISVSGDIGAITNADDLTTASETASTPTTPGASVSIPATEVKTSTAAVAAEWKSGNLTSLTNNQSGSISFAGVSININAKDGDTSGTSDVNQVGANLAIDSTGTAAEQAQQIVNAFKAVQSEQGSSGSLANFTFSADSNGQITINGTKEDGAKNNSFTLTTTGNVAVAGGANVGTETAGVTESRGEYSFEISTAFEKDGATLNIGGRTFTAVDGNADGSKGQFASGSDAKEQAISLAAAINADSTLNARFDAIVDGSKITLREKEMKATGVALADGFIQGTTNEAVKGEFSFNVDSSVAVGGKYSVDGVNIEVTDDKNHKGLANGTAVLFSADKTQQASNLANAIASNSTLVAKYDVAASADRVTLTQKDGMESTAGAQASTSTSKHENFQATFQVGANTIKV